MQTTWTHVAIAWGIIIVVLIACLVPELRKTPEQRKAEAEEARKSWKKNREAEKAKRQQERENAPAKGCLQSTMEFAFVSIFAFIAIIVAIMLLIASGD